MAQLKVQIYVDLAKILDEHWFIPGVFSSLNDSSVSVQELNDKNIPLKMVKKELN